VRTSSGLNVWPDIFARLRLARTGGGMSFEEDAPVRDFGFYGLGWLQGLVPVPP